MSKRRVVITGMGVVTSLGETADVMWGALCAGQSGVKTVTRFDLTNYPVKFGAECTDFDLTKYAGEAAKYTDEKLQPRRIDRFGQFGVAASLTAVADSGIDFTKEDTHRCGVHDRVRDRRDRDAGGAEQDPQHPGRQPGEPVHRPPPDGQRRQRERVDHLRHPRPQHGRRHRLCHRLQRDR